MSAQAVEEAALAEVFRTWLWGLQLTEPGYVDEEHSVFGVEEDVCTGSADNGLVC